MEKRFSVVYDALPKMSAKTIEVIAEYATPWREVFTDWMFDAPVVGYDTSFGRKNEAKREVNIHLRDSSGIYVTSKLSINVSYLREFVHKNPHRAFIKANYTISSPITIWIYGSFEIMWHNIAMRNLVNKDAIASRGWTLVNGIESDIMNIARSHWLKKPRRYRITH
jgi:hypothetical protein